MNRTINDPRRTVTASVPVRLTAPLDEARDVVLAALREVPEPTGLDLRLAIGEVTDKLVWLTVTGSHPPTPTSPRWRASSRARARRAARGGAATNVSSGPGPGAGPTCSVASTGSTLLRWRPATGLLGLFLAAGEVDAVVDQRREAAAHERAT